MGLIRRNGTHPPGNFPFRDERTGMSFAGEGGFEDQVYRIIRHRQANPGKYAPDETKWFHYDSVALELDAFTCQRLGNHPSWCGDPNAPQPIKALPIVAGKSCEKCGGPMGIEYCATCGGAKPKSLVCQNIKCGHIMPP